MSFKDQLDTSGINQKIDSANQVNSDFIHRLIQTRDFSPNTLPYLISPAAQPHLETMAQLAHQKTLERFGRTMQLFMPMYLSNECFNNCTYCGFSIIHKYPRKTLNKTELETEAKLIQDKGIQHILLLTGEAPGKVGTDYICDAIQTISPYFSSVGIEVQPLSHEDYVKTIDAGADSLTLYQETYHREAYKKYHLSGKKKNFDHRLDALEAGAAAGFHRITIGALMGLYDWQFEAIALAEHLQYLSKKFWQVKYGVSFPRIQEMVGQFTPPYPFSTENLVQTITAFRLCFPDLMITLSTREPAPLRDKLLPLGITTMSAESHTEPGGYSGMDTEKQFEISDDRTVEEIKTLLKQNGYDPVVKDWDMAFG